MVAKVKVVAALAVATLANARPELKLAARVVPLLALDDSLAIACPISSAGGVSVQSSHRLGNLLSRKKDFVTRKELRVRGLRSLRGVWRVIRASSNHSGGI